MIHHQLLFLLLLIATPRSTAITQPPFHGINITMLAQTPPPQNTDSAIRATAEKLLASYVKRQADHHLCQICLSGAAIWVELDNLHLTQGTTRPPTRTEKANGITESASIQIKYTAYRTYNQRTAQWSRACNQPNWYLPATITLEKTSDGKWQASTTNFYQLNRFSNPLPHSHAVTTVLPAAP